MNPPKKTSLFTSLQTLVVIPSSPFCYESELYFLTPNLLQIVKDSELKRQIFDLESLEFMLPQPSLHVLTALGCLSHVNVAFVRAPPPHPSGLLGNRQASWETKAKRFSGQGGGRKGGGGTCHMQVWLHLPREVLRSRREGV